MGGIHRFFRLISTVYRSSLGIEQRYIRIRDYLIEISEADACVYLLGRNSVLGHIVKKLYAVIVPWKTVVHHLVDLIRKHGRTLAVPVIGGFLDRTLNSLYLVFFAEMFLSSRSDII